MSSAWESADVPFNNNFSLGRSSGDQLLILSGLASSIFILGPN
jgi:hypothetical protein